MKRPRDRVVWTIGSMTGGVVLLLVILLWRSRAESSHIALADTPKPVTVVAAKPTTYRVKERLVATVEPWLSAKLSPQLVSAYVSSVTVRPGDKVKRGDVLATLDCKQASYANQSTVAQAKALEERERGLASETTRLESMATDGYVAQNDLEQRRAQLAATRAQIESARAQSATRSLEVGDCVLRAPFDGEVGARLVDPGAYVRPGMTIVTVIDRRLLRVSVEAPETLAGALAPSTAVGVKLLAVGDERAAVISRRAPAADPVTRTVHLEIDLDPKGAQIPVGTTATVSVEVGEPQKAIELPLTAANVRGEDATLFVLEDRAVKKRTAHILGERGGSLFLEPKIADGAQVVVEGKNGLRDNDIVIAKLAP